jgi:hypothetical protein
MELPTAWEKSKQIFLAHLKVHPYKFRDKQDYSATFTAPKVKKNKCTHKQGILPTEHEFMLFMNSFIMT